MNVFTKSLLIFLIEDQYQSTYIDFVQFNWLRNGMTNDSFDHAFFQPDFSDNVYNSQNYHCCIIEAISNYFVLFVL